MKTSESSTGASTPAQSTLFAADSPASLSVRPGSEEAQAMTVTSGRRCSESYARFSPLGSLVRTCLASSRWSSTRVLLTWKVRVTDARRLIFRLVESTPPTSDIGSGSLLMPTATAGDARSSGSRNTENSKANAGISLTDYVRGDGGKGRMWPTPGAHEDTGGGSTAVAEKAVSRTARPSGHRIQLTLRDAVKLWPTPAARDYKGAGVNAKPRDTLDMAVERGVTKSKLYPTPDVGAAKGRGQDSADNRSRLGGSLNPEWVEWLMGYPIGWTELED